MFTKMNVLYKEINAGYVLCFLFLLTAAAFAAEDSKKPQDIFSMSLEELMEVEVISGSRQLQFRKDLSVPVTVITAEDIHYSGLTTLPEILQYAVGVDVIRVDRHFSAVGVRGLHDYNADRTLTLINGRTADSAFFGGSEFYRLPILVEDIDRIEIVRGPGGAAWGANAFTGVINIITKKPEDMLGAFASTTVNEFGDTYTHLRFAEKKGKWAWRASGGYEDHGSSKESGAGRFESQGSPLVNSLIGFNSFSAADFARNSRFDIEAIYDYSDQTKFSLGTGYAHSERGDRELGGFFPPDNMLYETVRPYFRVDHIFDDDSTGYLQWFSNILDSKVPTYANWFTMENDIEAQINFKPVEDHQISVGGNIRFVYVDIESKDPQHFMMTNEPFDEFLAGLFLIDRWQVTDRLVLEGQIRGDYYSETHNDWSTRLTALYSLDELKEQVLRFSFARAYRAPKANLRDTTAERIPLGGGLNGFNVISAPELNNEKTWSLEGGYIGTLTKDLQLTVNGYYQRFEDMIGYQAISDPLFPGLLPEPRAIYQARNIDGMDSYGIEIELEKRWKQGKLSAWYAYNDADRDQPNQNVRAYAPADHKVGLTGRLFLPEDYTLNANYRYTNTTRAFACQLMDVEQSHCLDLTVSKRFAKGNGELMFGVSDVLNETRGPDYGMGMITAFETPGRTFFARLQMHF